jgi:Family of unknown function (DUF5994)
MALLTNVPPSPAPAGAPGVRFEPVPFHHTMLDGCWWPLSGDPAAELPVLVRALDTVRGPIVRLLLSAAGWVRRPHHVDVAGREISLGYFSDQPAAMLTAICSDGGTLTMLVVAADRPAVG